MGQLSTLVQGVAVVIVTLWLLTTVGSFLTILLSIVWLLLNPTPSGQTSGSSLTQNWMKSYDDLGEVFTSQRLATTRKVLMVSASTFVVSLMIGAAFCLLKALAG